jgi:hypothetical protein
VRRAGDPNVIAVLDAACGLLETPELHSEPLDY